jgi:cysteine desulfurase family protein (TIGR01976 family)
LKRQVGGRPAVFFDGPAGSQIPQRVADAVAHYLLHSNANEGGDFVTSRETEAMLARARETLGVFLGAPDPSEEIVFGPNMTSLTFAFSRAFAAELGPGDEVLVGSTEHDANFTPWVRAAEEAGATVRQVAARLPDCQTDLEDLRSKLSDRTRLVAVGLASNAVGSINPIAEIAEIVHGVGAQLWVDAVHYAPHGPIDVAALGCDYLVVSAYKFFGPHVGVLWGRRSLLAQLKPYKVRPAPGSGPDRWMSGTPNLEGIAGALEAVRYLADLGAEKPSLRGRLLSAWDRVESHERSLFERLLAGVSRLRGYRVWGISDLSRMAERVPTLSLTHERIAPQQLAASLAEEGIFTWGGHHYALPLTEALGLDPSGTLRIGLLHYNTEAEVDRLLEALARYDSAS